MSSACILQTLRSEVVLRNLKRIRSLLNSMFHFPKVQNLETLFVTEFFFYKQVHTDKYIYHKSQTDKTIIKLSNCSLVEYFYTSGPKTEDQMMVYTGLLLIIAILKTINCARILLVFPHVSVSHHVIGASLAAGLSESGHEVTLLSPNIHVELYNLEFNGSPPYNWVKFETFCDPIESKS